MLVVRDLQDYLARLDPFRIKLGLAPTRKALARLGNPHHRLRIIHVAGTNGKGSTCAFSARILHAAGYRVGLYTSPHLFDVRERICVDGRPISPADFIRCAGRVRSALGKPPAFRLTYFEFLTVVAFDYFARRGVDFAVVETGMGGRLDATNVVLPTVSVITTLGLDHTQWLGSSIKAISREKSMIIKPGIPAVAARRHPVLLVRARECGRPLAVPGYGVEWSWSPPNVLRYRRKIYPLALHGSCYALSAALAIRAVEEMGLHLPPAAIRRGLSGCVWPGRGQFVRARGRDWILDVAHNPQAIRQLGKNLRERFPRRGIHLILTIVRGKDAVEILREAARWSHRIFLTAPGPLPQILSSSEFQEAMEKSGVRADLFPNLVLTLDRTLRSSTPEDLVVVSGSHTLVAAALRLLGIRPPV